jgi:DNA-binding response OmpR family regulator
MTNRVLIVEDDNGIASGLADVVTYFCDMTPEVVDNIDDAVKLATEGNWSAAIVDGNLTSGVVTGDDGRLISNILSGRGIPVIGYSADREPYQPESFWVEHGAYFRKPTGAALLGEAVKSLASVSV